MRKVIAVLVLVFTLICLPSCAKQHGIFVKLGKGNEAQVVNNSDLYGAVDIIGKIIGYVQMYDGGQDFIIDNTGKVIPGLRLVSIDVTKVSSNRIVGGDEGYLLIKPGDAIPVLSDGFDEQVYTKFDKAVLEIRVIPTQDVNWLTEHAVLLNMDDIERSAYIKNMSKEKLDKYSEGSKRFFETEAITIECIFYQRK